MSVCFLHCCSPNFHHTFISWLGVCLYQLIALLPLPAQVYFDEPPLQPVVLRLQMGLGIFSPKLPKLS